MRWIRTYNLLILWQNLLCLRIVIARDSILDAMNKKLWTTVKLKSYGAQTKL